MEPKVSLELIVNTMKNWIESKVPIQPSVYLDSAIKMNILLEDLDDDIAQKHMELEKLERKQKRVVEHIRIAKKLADLKSYQ